MLRQVGRVWPVGNGGWALAKVERWAAEEAGNWRLTHCTSGVARAGPAARSLHPRNKFLMNRSQVHLLGSGGRPKQEARIGLKLSRIFRRSSTKIYNPRASTWAHKQPGKRRWPGRQALALRAFRRHARFKISHFVHLYPLPSPPPCSDNPPASQAPKKWAAPRSILRSVAWAVNSDWMWRPQASGIADRVDQIPREEANTQNTTGTPSTPKCCSCPARESDKK